MQGTLKLRKHEAPVCNPYEGARSASGTWTRQGEELGEGPDQGPARPWRTTGSAGRRRGTHGAMPTAREVGNHSGHAPCAPPPGKASQCRHKRATLGSATVCRIGQGSARAASAPARPKKTGTPTATRSMHKLAALHRGSARQTADRKKNSEQLDTSVPGAGQTPNQRVGSTIGKLRHSQRCQRGPGA